MDNHDRDASAKTYRHPRYALIPDAYIYISHLDEDMRFWRLPSVPDNINDSQSASFNSTNALGRSAPIMTYSNSGSRTISFDFKLHRDMMDDINTGVSNAELLDGEDYIDSLVRALRSIALPKYNLSNKYVEPPMVAVRLCDEIFIKGVVNGNISVSYGNPILENNRYARVGVSFAITETDPQSAQSVFKNGGFRGVVNTLRKGMGLE